MRKTGFLFIFLLAALQLSFLSSCSHDYDPDTLDLGFYQWNLWYDSSPEGEQPIPSCGWEELHRGKGKLVRIPALAKDHFREKQEQGVLSYH